MGQEMYEVHAVNQGRKSDGNCCQVVYARYYNHTAVVLQQHGSSTYDTADSTWTAYY